MSFQYILVDNKDNLRIIKFNNPKKKNALNLEAYIEITNALKDASQDESITIVALTGVGNYYSSGNDISASLKYEGNLDEIFENASKILENFIKAFYNFPKILIAVVNGPCIGIAATTAALCDIIYCSEKVNILFYNFTLQNIQKIF